MLASGDLVVDEVILQQQGAAVISFAQHYLRTQRDQQGWRIADGRGVTDVAAQGALVADLQRGEAVQQLTEIRVFLRQHFIAIGQRCGGADLDTGIGHLDFLHFDDVADVNHHRQFAVELGDFQGEVGAAGQQTGVRVGAVDLGQVTHGQR